MKTFHTDVAVLIERLFTLERRGRYEESLSELRSIWEDTSTIPDVSGLSPRDAAEIILRCGAVIGFLGHIKQIPHSQEKSKNLLAEARNRFLEIYDVEKIVECENYIALGYWRTGELTEAEIWIEEALSHSINKISDAWVYSNLTKSLIYLSLARHEEIVENLSRAKTYFRQYGNDFLNGCFCSNISIALRNLGRIPEAMNYLERARGYHQKSRHEVYLGAVENNLAYLYKSLGRFSESHQAVDNAVKTYRRIKDRTHEGFVLDTKATIFIDEGKYNEALKVVDTAISILKKSENAAYLVETCLTKSKILLKLDDFSAAFLCLSEAVQVARTQISEDAAKKLAKEFEKALKQNGPAVIRETFNEKEAETRDLQLVLPASLSHYRDFQGVWIKNSYFEHIGLAKGSLAVVTSEKIARGDLIAITEISTDSVLCGFYDSEFGIVCLEGLGSEPLLFDEKEIKILGKIIGVGSSEKTADGKMIVVPIRF